MSEKTKRGTFIHGIAASEHIDSSGERIMIEGVDITSLTKDGTFNYEHDSKSPSSIVGKIWEAKKILKRADCDNESQKYFWDKIKMPYIYVAGELFDSVGHKAAGEVAAMLRYDQMDSMNKDAKKLINFSIEGSRVEKSGQVITKCIARKVSVTLTPCNKVCEAEELHMDDGAKKESDSGDFKFIQDIMDKSDASSCELIKGEVSFLYKNDIDKSIEDQMFYESHRKEIRAKGKARGEKIRNKKPGIIDRVKAAFKPKQAPVAAPIHAEPKDHKIAASEKKPKNKLSKYDSNVRKALTASCGMGAPSTKVGGEVLGKEENIPLNPPNRPKVKTNSVGLNQKTVRARRLTTHEPKAQTAEYHQESSPVHGHAKALVKSEFIYKNEQAPKNPQPNVAPNQGTKIGRTKSGKDIFSHAMVGSYKGFSPQDHVEAAEFHRQMVNKMPSFKDKEMHMNKMRLHTGAFSTARNKEIAVEGNRPVNGKPMNAAPLAPAIPAMPKMNPATANMTMPKGGNGGYSAMASAYGQTPPPAKPPMGVASMPKMPAPAMAPVAPMANPNMKMKMAKSEVFIIRKLDEADVIKGSKNVREQRKKVFGSKSQPGANTPMREKHIQHIKQFVDKHLGLDLQPSGGKVNDKTGERRNAENEEGVDKPDWRSGKFEAQWNPEAIVHEIAHLMLLPKGVGLEEGQRLMDKQYSNVQKEHGYMQQKRSKYEVQPMAAEQLIRRAMGLPASNVSIPVKSKEDPHRMSLEDPTQPIATRIQSGKQKDGTPKFVDLIRQSRNLHPEHKQRLTDIFSGKLQFHPDKGWSEKNKTLDGAISNRAPGAVMARQNKKQMAAPTPTELPPNVVRMKQPAAPAPAAEAPPQQPPMKIAKSEQRKIMKMLGDQAFDAFEKKEELLEFLAEKLPKLSEQERKALAKAVAYTSEKKKEEALKLLLEE